MLVCIAGKIKPEVLFFPKGKYAKGRKTGVGTSAMTRLLNPATIFLLGTTFAFFTPM